MVFLIKALTLSGHGICWWWDLRHCKKYKPWSRKHLMMTTSIKKKVGPFFHLLDVHCRKLHLSTNGLKRSDAKIFLLVVVRKVIKTLWNSTIVSNSILWHSRMFECLAILKCSNIEILDFQFTFLIQNWKIDLAKLWNS